MGIVRVEFRIHQDDVLAVGDRFHHHEHKV